MTVLKETNTLAMPGTCTANERITMATTQTMRIPPLPAKLGQPSEEDRIGRRRRVPLTECGFCGRRHQLFGA